MTALIAALPMYDWPEARSEVDCQWTRLRGVLREGGIARDLCISTPRPRHRGDPHLAALKEELLDGLIAAEAAS